MAVELATAYISLVPSARGIRSQVEKELDLEKPAKDAGAKAGKGFAAAFDAETARKMQDTGKKMALAGVAIGGGLLAAANAAGNLEAAIAANVQVLGDASRETQEWAKNSVDAVGLSERAALEASTTFAMFGKEAGLTGDALAQFSIKQIEMAADWAAFKDTSPAQVIEDMRAAYAGSSETLQKYIGTVNDGAIKQAYFEQTGERVTGVMDGQQRVIGLTALMMEKGADMSGQWDRESESLAAQQAKLKAELENMGASIGATVLPAVTEMTGGLASAFSTIADLNESTGGMVGTFAAMSAASLTLGGGALFTAGKIAQLQRSLAAMSTTAKLSAGALAAIPVAIVAGQAIYNAFTAKQREIDQRASEVAASLGEQVDATIAAGDAAEGASVGLTALSRSLVMNGEDGQKLTQSLGVLGETADEAVDILIEMGGDPVSALRDLALSAGATSEEAEALAEIVNDYDKSFMVAQVVSQELGEDLVEVALAMEEVQDQQEKSDLDKMVREYLASSAAIETNGQELLALAEKQTGLKRTGDELLPLYEAYTDLLAENADTAGDVSDETDGARRSIDQMAAAAKLGQTNAEQWGRSQSGAAQVAADYAEQVESAREALADLVSEVESSLRSTFDHEQAVLGMESAFADYEAQLWETTAALNDGTLSDREAEQAKRDLRGQEIGLAKDALATAEAYAVEMGAVKGTAESSAMQIRALQEMKAEYPLLGDEIDGYIDQLDDIPGTRQTLIQVMIDEGLLLNGEQRLSHLARNRIAHITPQIGAPREAPRVFADGAAYVSSPTYGLFGEAGPEAILPLSRPGRMADIVNDSRVQPAVLEALGVAESAGVSKSVNFGDVTIESGVDLDEVFARANFYLAVMR